MMNKSDSKRKQADKFKETARQHECDEDEKAFDEKLKRLAKQKRKKDDESSD